MKMKKITEAIPFALLLGLVPHFYVNTPNIAQSIIVLGLAGLCGFRLFCMDKEKPDYVALFQESFDTYKNDKDTEIAEMKGKHEKAMLHLEKQVKSLSDSYGKITMERTSKSKVSQFEF